MTVKERISEFLEYKRVNSAAFERSIGKCRSWWSKSSNPTADNLVLIFEAYPDLSAEWVFRGEGNMLKGDNHTTTVINVNRPGDNNTGVVGNNNTVSDNVTAMDLLSRMQEQITRLTEVNYKLTMSAISGHKDIK